MTLDLTRLTAQESNSDVSFLERSPCALVVYLQSKCGAPASVTSVTLENMYLADRSKEVPFSAGQQQYVLHFQGAPGATQMYQQNLKHKTKREIRRRPRFVSAHDVEGKLKRYFLFQFPVGEVLNYPGGVASRKNLFVRVNDVYPVYRGSSQSSSSSATEDFPFHWDKTALPDFGYTVSP